MKSGYMFAMRFEDCSGFGETFGYTLAGFRAPAPGLLGTTNVSTVFGDSGEPIAQGLFPATNPVSAFPGACEFMTEKADN
jgi:iron complex outermembrane receptor protein